MANLLSKVYDWKFHTAKCCHPDPLTLKSFEGNIRSLEMRINPIRTKSFSHFGRLKD